MIVVKNKLIPFGRFDAMAVWPFIFVKEEVSDKVINHERIHGRQQVEMLFVLFYLWYGIEWLLRAIFGTGIAYRNISLEREAYLNQRNAEYLKHRKFWAWTKYL